MTGPDPGLLLAAWLTGLAGGSGHCIGMCGGIASSLGLGQGRSLRGLLRVAAAHLGRVTSYMVAGSIAGFAGAALVTGVFGANAMLVLRGLAAAIILAIGLQLLFGWPLLRVIEQGGARFWQLLAPQMRRLVPPADPLRAFGVGALWGWLPCGLVFAQLAVAAASGGAAAGALIMLVFGLGTTIGLSLLGVLLHALGLARLPRQASGALLVVFAVWTIVPLLSMH